MANEPTAHFRWFLEDGVAIIEVLCRELNLPRIAEEFGAQLGALLASRPADRYLLNFHRTPYMSSTAFATVLVFSKAAKEAGARIAICGMAPAVRIGADVLCLDQFIPIFDDEPTALAALRGEGRV